MDHGTIQQEQGQVDVLPELLIEMDAAWYM